MNSLLPSTPYALQPTTFSGFLLVDKPAGLTSFGVIRQIKKITGIKKIGHAGTLDPMATGILILALNKATKQLTSLIKHDKEYEAEILLGAESDTYDKEGKINFNDPNLLKNITEQQIKETLKNFIGEIEQTPPVYSALKINGRRACDIIRKGGQVELKPRQVQVYSIEISTPYNLQPTPSLILPLVFPKKLKSYKLPPPTPYNLQPTTSLSPIPYPLNPPPSKSYQLKAISLSLHCSSGFYVRSLAHDLGEKLGCGALLYNLRRTKVGDIDINQTVKLKKLNTENWQKYLIKLPTKEKILSELEQDEKKWKEKGGYSFEEVMKKSHPTIPKNLKT